MSEGMRSGVNCIRATFKDMACARARTSNVLPRPGTPSTSTCPDTQRAMMVWSTTAVCPTSAVPTLARSFASSSPARRMVFDSSFMLAHLGFENLRLQTSPRALEQHDCRPLRFRAAIEVFVQRVAQGAGVETGVRRQRADALGSVHPLIGREPPACRLHERLALGTAQGREASSSPRKARSRAYLLGERTSQRQRRQSDRPEARQVAP